MLRSLQRIPAWPAVAAWMTAILAASSIPVRGEPNFPRAAPGPIPFPTDKAAHIAEFAGLAFLIVRALMSDAPHPTRTAPAILGAIAAATVFGALDELHQRSVPGRTAAWDDIAADALGATIGALTAAALYARARVSPHHAPPCRS